MMKKALVVLASSAILVGTLAGCSSEPEGTVDDGVVSSESIVSEQLTTDQATTVAALQEMIPSINWEPFAAYQWDSSNGSKTSGLPGENDRTEYNFSKIGVADDALIQAFIAANQGAEGWNIIDISNPEADEEGNGRTVAYILEQGDFRIYTGALSDNGGQTFISVSQQSSAQVEGGGEEVVDSATEEAESVAGADTDGSN